MAPRTPGFPPCLGALSSHCLPPSSYDPISMVRDNEVKAGLAAAGVHCHSFNAEILREPWETLGPGGKVGGAGRGGAGPK